MNHDRRCGLALAASLLGTLGAIGAAHASMVYVNPLGGGDGRERCLMGTDGVCGGTGTNYSGAPSIMQVLSNDVGSGVVRIDDSLGAVWQSSGTVLIRTRADYAGDTDELGYDSGSGFVGLISQGNSRLYVSSKSSCSGVRSFDCSARLPAWTTIPVTAGTPFALVLDDKTEPNMWSSNNTGHGVGSSGYSNSAGGTDPYSQQMVIFQVVSNPNEYFVAWKDRPSQTSDHDYNDFVAEVLIEPATVPLPASAWLLASGLLGLAAVRRRGKATIGLANGAQA